jgi:hypothetical protein
MNESVVAGLTVQAKRLQSTYRNTDVAFSRVEDGRGSLGPMANAPFPIPPGRRRQLPASGSHRT